MPATVPAPLVLPQDAPVDEDFPPMAFELTPAEAEAWAAVGMGDDHARYRQGDGQRVHPSWLPAQYVPLVRGVNLVALNINDSLTAIQCEC